MLVIISWAADLERGKPSFTFCDLLASRCPSPVGLYVALLLLMHICVLEKYLGS